MAFIPFLVASVFSGNGYTWHLLKIEENNTSPFPEITESFWEKKACGDGGMVGSRRGKVKPFGSVVPVLVRRESAKRELSEQLTLQSIYLEDWKCVVGMPSHTARNSGAMVKSKAPLPSISQGIEVL